jgi:hypothetical protein
VKKKKNKDNNRMIRIDERASNGQQAASKWTMGGMVLFTGRTLSTMVSDESEEEEEPYLEKCMFVHSALPASWEEWFCLPEGRCALSTMISDPKRPRTVPPALPS